MRVLVTGAAGFIGMHTSKRLLARGDEVVGIDSLNDYYSPDLKRARLAQLTSCSRFTFEGLNIADRTAVERLFSQHAFDAVVHLAAQPGVRYSIQHPHAYVESNLVGFVNVLEGCRHARLKHLVYASSSSVYGGNTKMPFAEHDNVDRPVSLYAATKKANELMAHTYSHLYGVPTTGLRFFTVYGPWGRPDMSPMLFADAIVAGRPIQVFNHGQMARDFTYIDDIVEGLIRVLDKPATQDADGSGAAYRIFNIGNSQPVPLLEYIGAIEAAFGRTTVKEFLPMQAGDVSATHSDTSALEAWVGFRPTTPLRVGVGHFADWYLSYYRHDLTASRATLVTSRSQA